MTTTKGLAANLRMLIPTAAAALVPIAGCHSATPVEPARECADPCCSGNPTGIDCAQNPNVSCMQDADVCTALAYGCANGMYYAMVANQLPSCTSDGSFGEMGLVLGNPAANGSDDGGDSSGD